MCSAISTVIAPIGYLNIYNEADKHAIPVTLVCHTGSADVTTLNYESQYEKDMMLRIAFVLGMSVDETQEMLKTAQRAVLSSKDRRDVCIIFGLAMNFLMRLKSASALAAYFAASDGRTCGALGERALPDWPPANALAYSLMAMAAKHSLKT